MAMLDESPAMTEAERLERYARQAFARATGGHLCDLITERADGDQFLIGCPEHGYVMMRYRMTGKQARRTRRKSGNYE